MVLASVGSYSGPAGTVFVPLLQGAQLWVRSINDRGGLNGHTVKLIVHDDGGDPARHRAALQKAVEGEKAIGFLMNADAVTGQAGASYITSKRVPVIGTTGGSVWASGSPMYFPQMANDKSWSATMLPPIAPRVLAQGKSKLGSVVCIEAPYCDTADENIARQAEPNGLEHVYRARASLAQPDFTAECLAARNAGVEVFMVLEDQNSISRVAASCARQGFKPIFATIPTVTVDALKNDPNLEGFLSSSNVFPYFQSGTPATDQYQQAMQTYGKGVTPGVSVAMGWVAGKVVERAAAQLPEAPTSAALLAGLWTIQNDDLGGLAAPLTFVQDQPAKSPACWYNLEVRGKKWLSPDGYKLFCV